jgi:hypothetical protein
VPKLFSEWSCHDLFLLRLLVGSESLRNRSWTTSGDHAELVGVMGVESVCVVFIIKQSTTEKLSALAAPKSSCLCFVSPIQCFLAGVHQQSSQQVVSELRSVLGNVFSGGSRTPHGRGYSSGRRISLSPPPRRGRTNNQEVVVHQRVIKDAGGSMSWPMLTRSNYDD